MKYLGLAYFSPEKFAAMAPDQVERLVSQCPALDEQMHATGKVLLAASLGDVAGWTTLRPAMAGRRSATGPTRNRRKWWAGCSSSRPTTMTRRCASLPCILPPPWAKRGAGRWS